MVFRRKAIERRVEELTYRLYSTDGATKRIMVVSSQLGLYLTDLSLYFSPLKLDMRSHVLETIYSGLRRTAFHCERFSSYSVCGITIPST